MDGVRRVDTVVVLSFVFKLLAELDFTKCGTCEWILPRHNSVLFPGWR